MAPDIVDDETLATLSSSAFSTPRSRPAGNLDAFLGTQFDLFFARLELLRGPLHDRISQRLERARELASSLQACAEWARRGRSDRAWEVLEYALDDHTAAIDLLSLRLAHTVEGSRAWYRMSTWPGATLRRDVFHLPFERPAGAYRFSPPGQPALYLGNNVHTCWLECGKPPIETCRVARFELRLSEGEELLNLPANHAVFLGPLQASASFRKHSVDPRRVMNSPYLDDVIEELADYLALWPLLMAYTVEKLEPASDSPPEYVIPQLLMRWALQRTRYAGIRYFTSRSDPSSNSNDMAINAVLPARVHKPSGFCDYLRARAFCTLPSPLTAPVGVPAKELYSDQAASDREHMRGRTMILSERGLESYHATPFGRMEYWLDRADAVVAPIEDA